MTLKEESEQKRVLYRSRQDDHFRVMLVLVPIDITPPHTPLPVFWQIGKQMIPYSCRACLSVTYSAKSVTFALGARTRFKCSTGKGHLAIKLDQ
ncbi:hypothetical protein TNCV_1510281 [Trichonephila clavipes]|nr:hypothetical protein TNCV_1510281 [Trichonephila clavipes]